MSNGLYRDPATGSIAPMYGGMRGGYNPSSGDEEQNDGTSGLSLAKRIKAFKNLPAFAAGSPERKAYSEHIKQFTGPFGTALSSWSAATGYDPVAGHCLSIDERLGEALSAAVDVHGRLSEAARSGRGPVRKLVDVPIHPKFNRFYVKASELLNEANIKRLHPIYEEQLKGSEYVGHSGVSNLSNEDLLKFGGPHGNDPISGFRSYPTSFGTDFSGPGPTINIRGGHHRLFEIAKRVGEGKISPDTLIEFEVKP